MTDVADAINLLRRGVSEWNSGRADGPIDLSHIEVRGASLPGARLDRVDFDGSEFVSVDLSGASLRRSRLNGVHMELVRLERATLEGAECKGTDLDRVQLSGACLRDLQAFELKIRRSELSGVTFSGADLRSTHIYNSDLSRVAWNDVAVDWVALKRVDASDDLLDRLRRDGCRVELAHQRLHHDLVDWDSVAVPDPRGSPACIVHDGTTYWFAVGRWDFFISHATADKHAFARPLAEALRQLGQRVWLDVIELRANDDLDTVIGYGTRAANFAVAIVSPRFFGRPWTERELDLLTAKRMFLVLCDGFTLDDLEAIRPTLSSRVTIDGNSGPDAVARELVAAISRPPGEM